MSLYDKAKVEALLAQLDQDPAGVVYLLAALHGGTLQPVRTLHQMSAFQALGPHEQVDFIYALRERVHRGFGTLEEHYKRRAQGSED